MGKRSSFERIERDFYATPRDPVLALAPHLDDVEAFAEPFVGDGQLADFLEGLGHICGYASDIQPDMRAELAFRAETRDALTVGELELMGVSHIISNPPWPKPRANGQPTIGLIQHLAALRPTWLLLAADFAHNVYAPAVMAYCRKIVSVGRVRWIEDSEHDGKDNAAWFLFDASEPGPTIFYARGPKRAVFSSDLECLL